jgi:hypothetical protein
VARGYLAPGLLDLPQEQYQPYGLSHDTGRPRRSSPPAGLGPSVGGDHHHGDGIGLAPRRTNHFVTGARKVQVGDHHIVASLAETLTGILGRPRLVHVEPMLL